MLRMELFNLWKIIYCPNHGFLLQVNSRCISHTYSSTEFQLVIVAQEEILIGILQIQTDFHPFFGLVEKFLCFAHF